MTEKGNYSPCEEITKKCSFFTRRKMPMKGKLTKMYEIVRTHKITFYPEEIQIEFEDIENNVCEILFETYEEADEMLENEICLNYDTFASEP